MVRCGAVAVSAADVDNERRCHNLSESCSSNRRDVRCAVSVHLCALQRRLLDDLLETGLHGGRGS